MKITESKLREMTRSILKEYSPGESGNYYAGDEKEIEQARDSIRKELKVLIRMGVIDPAGLSSVETLLDELSSEQEESGTGMPVNNLAKFGLGSRDDYGDEY